MKNCLQHILDQGFGLYSINEALSIRYCNDEMVLCVTPLPGLNDEPINVLLHRRTPGGIREEIGVAINLIIIKYRDTMWEDIQRL